MEGERTRERASTRERGASVAITDPTTCRECTVLCKHFLHHWPQLESEACTERNVHHHVHDELRDYPGALGIYGAGREGKADGNGEQRERERENRRRRRARVNMFEDG